MSESPRWPLERAAPNLPLAGTGVRSEPGLAEETVRLIRQTLAPHFQELARCRSTRELEAHPVYRRLRPAIDTVLETPEIGTWSRRTAPPRSRYHFVAWNLERGIELDAQIEVLRSHPLLRQADVLLLTETDAGMARSRNRAVAHEIARALELHYAFAPCYLNLSKGSGWEFDAPGENRLGLAGNAVLSRYPISSARSVPLASGADLMKGREKRLGRERACLAEIEFPNARLVAAAVHLDANSSQRHRARQMRQVLAAFGPGGAASAPAVIGGDWNTSTYNSSHAFYAIPGFWLRVLMGVDNVIQNHYLHPYRRFERDLFRSLERAGFDYRNCNVLGERTAGYDASCPKTRQNLSEWVPDWCFAFMRWALRHQGGRCPIKLDWLATRGARAANPAVIHELRERARPLSDHDPVAVDVRLD